MQILELEHHACTSIMRARQLVESGIAVASRPLLRNNASGIETYEAKPIGSNDAVFHSLEAAAVMNQRGGRFFPAAEFNRVPSKDLASCAF